jgi:hypothetical protein
MPLVKTLFGRRIRKTKRRGDQILVQLAPHCPGGNQPWVSLSEKDYRAEMKCVYVPAGQSSAGALGEEDPC